jgi:hypothetical protein
MSVFASQRVLSAPWLDGARLANTCIQPSFLGNAPKSAFASIKKLKLLNYSPMIYNSPYELFKIKKLPNCFVWGIIFEPLNDNFMNLQ